MSMEEKLKELQEVERARLPFMKRWTKVDVFIEGDKLVHYWNGVGRDNPGWEFHRIERPVDNIQYYITYHRKKLSEER